MADVAATDLLEVAAPELTLPYLAWEHRHTIGAVVALVLVLIAIFAYSESWMIVGTIFLLPALGLLLYSGKYFWEKSKSS